MDIADVRVAPLCDFPQHCAPLAAAFEAEWPAWYGPEGPGDARADLRAFADPQRALPVGVVALDAQDAPIGVAALKARSVDSHAHLSPWAAAGYVQPAWRRQGVGARLLDALCAEAVRLGYGAVYCATATSASLLARAGWQLVDTVQHDGRPLQVFRSPSIAVT